MRLPERSRFACKSQFSRKVVLPLATHQPQEGAGVLTTQTNPPTLVDQKADNDNALQTEKREETCRFERFFVTLQTNNYWYPMKDLFNIATNFLLAGTPSTIEPLGNGLINDTYIIVTKEDDAPDYVLQHINHHIFTNVELLQSNIEAVTAHIRKKHETAGEEDIDRKVLRFIPTAEGKTYWFDGDQYWRVMVFIDHTITKTAIDAESSYNAGVAFGNFQSMLADIPVQLGETIPDFHNMEFRMKQLREAVAADAAGRVAEMRFYIDEMEKRAEEMCKGERLFREGRLPKRVCHCDTKVNNMLYNEDETICCVIDLDTVMPSFIFSDFGDFLRTGACSLPEDDPDIEHVGFKMDIFRAFAKGYVEATRSFLLPIEKENLPYAAALFPYMQCVRFLADYLNGDTYYKIKYPEHNLVRAKNQYQLLLSVEAHMAEMKAYIDSL